MLLSSAKAWWDGKIGGLLVRVIAVALAEALLEHGEGN